MTASPVFSLAHLTVETSPAETLEIAAATGYSHAGIRLLPAAPGGQAFPLMDDPAQLAATLARQRDTGVQIFDLEMIRLDARFDLEHYRSFLETGGQLGARAILVAADDTDSHRLTDNLAALCDAAAPYGLSCDLEFMPWTAVADLGQALRILEPIHAPNVGLLLDSLHFFRSDSRPEQVAELPRHWLHYAQLCDGPLQPPVGTEALIRAARTERLLPGSGGLPLQQLWQSIPRDTPISVEIPHQTLRQQMGVEAWARQALEHSRAFISTLAH